MCAFFLSIKFLLRTDHNTLVLFLYRVNTHETDAYVFVKYTIMCAMCDGFECMRVHVVLV